MWLTAVILGVAGSLHCAGMCSPLVIAVTSLSGRAMKNRIVYNGGRILTYGVLGSLIAFAGSMISFSGLQFFLTIALGAALIVMGVSGITGLNVPLITPAMTRFTGMIKLTFSRFLQQKTTTAMLALGMLNGLLPCGLTYLALTYCLTLQGPSDGFYFMVLFGAGTLPAMIGLTSVIAYLVKRFQLNLSRLTRYSFIVVGGIVLLRLILMHQHELAVAGEKTGIILCQ